MSYKVFVAYSGRHSELGNAVTGHLGEGENVEASRWPTAFRFGESTFEGLLQKARQYDFGVFAFSPDDFRIVEGKNFLAPNVLFELGVFAGAKGKERAFLLTPQGYENAVPADLQGITHATYDPGNLEVSVDHACLLIGRQIREVACTDCHFLLNRKSGKCLDVEAFGKNDGDPVIQWTFHGGPNQLWSLEQVEAGWFKITSLNSGKCLQVRAGSMEEDALVEQGSYKGKPHQQWSLTPTPFGNGAYQIKARHSGQCLAVKGDSVANKTPVVQRIWEEDKSFLWSLASTFTLN
ncbi:MAG TPA: RICIN domain-containing protein [Thermoanaerobaculia bacterium]|nr:RICIN domain-containing protein [Thermoanaerobaculia bacterium]